MTDLQIYKRYISQMKKAAGLTSAESVAFSRAFSKYMSDNPTKSISVAFNTFWKQYGMREDLAQIVQASIIKQSAVGYAMPSASLELIIKNTNDKKMKQIFGKTNGAKLSSNVYSSVDNTQETIYNELARLDKDVVGFRNSVKNITEVLGKGIKKEKLVSGYIRDLERSAKKIIDNPSDEALKAFEQARKKAQIQVSKLTGNRTFSASQRQVIRDITRGVEKKLPEIIEKGVQRAINSKVKSSMERLVITENSRVFEQSRYNDRLDNGFVSAVRFRLSSAHNKYDQCDILASYDGFGLGAGVFPINQQPRMPIHPNGISYLVSVTTNKISMEKALSRKYNEKAFLKQANKQTLPKSQKDTFKNMEFMKRVNIDKEALKQAV